MSRKLAPWLVAGAAATLTAIAAAPASADAIFLIEPDQHFTGLVNPDTHPDMIWTGFCHTSPAGVRFAYPLSDQYVAVKRDPTGDGYTGGAADRIEVQIPSPIPTVAPQQVTLRYYDLRVLIPTTFTVPCNDTKTVNFVPQPDDPTNPSKTDKVKIQFVALPPPPPA